MTLREFIERLPDQQDCELNAMVHIKMPEADALQIGYTEAWTKVRVKDAVVDDQGGITLILESINA